MSNHQNEHQQKPEAEKIKLAVTISDHPPIDKQIGGSSLTNEEKIPRKVPRKPRRYHMSATVKEMRAMLPKKVIQVVETITWLTTDAAALYIGTSPTALRQKAYRRQIVSYQPFGGRNLYFKKSDLDQAIESSKKVGGKNGNKKG